MYRIGRDKLQNIMNEKPVLLGARAMQHHGSVQGCSSSNSNSSSSSTQNAPTTPEPVEVGSLGVDRQLEIVRYSRAHTVKMAAQKFGVSVRAVLRLRSIQATLERRCNQLDNTLGNSSAPSGYIMYSLTII